MFFHGIKFCIEKKVNNTFQRVWFHSHDKGTYMRSYIIGWDIYNGLSDWPELFAVTRNNIFFRYFEPSKNEMSILTQFSPSAHLVHI